MNWDAIQNDAKAKGHLVFAVDQAQTAVLTQPGPWGSAFDGYCIGLCANWVALQYRREELSGRRRQDVRQPAVAIDTGAEPVRRQQERRLDRLVEGSDGPLHL